MRAPVCVRAFVLYRELTTEARSETTESVPVHARMSHCIGMLAWGTQQLSASTSVNKLIAGGLGPHNLLQLNTNCRLWCQAAVLQMGRPSHMYGCIGDQEKEM